MANTRNDPTGRYAFLRALTTEQLEQLLKADYSGTMPEDAAEEFIDAVIEVMLEKEKEDPSGRLAEVDKAWADFQRYYNVPDRDGQLLYPDLVSPEPAPSQKAPTRRPKRAARPVALIAAAIGVFMSLLVVAQAAGLDVFGAMARWTEEVFTYHAESDYYPAVRDAFVQNHFPEELVPKWYPKGFVPSGAKRMDEKFSTAIYVPFSNHSEGKEFSIAVRRYSSPGGLPTLEHQRDPDSQQQYTSAGRTFFLVSNEGYTTATWSDRDTLVMTLAGDVSVRDMEKVIDSIGG